MQHVSPWLRRTSVLCLPVRMQVGWGSEGYGIAPGEMTALSDSIYLGAPSLLPVQGEEPGLHILSRSEKGPYTRPPPPRDLLNSASLPAQGSFGVSLVYGRKPEYPEGTQGDPEKTHKLQGGSSPAGTRTNQPGRNTHHSATVLSRYMLSYSKNFDHCPTIHG